MFATVARSIARWNYLLVPESICKLPAACSRFIYTISEGEKKVLEPDRLFMKIHLEMRGHDKAVLKSYTTFLQTTCHHLSIKCTPVQTLPYFRWIVPLLRAKFVLKKYKLHYETRTHIHRMSVEKLTGSTASTFLEYIERNIPEGVALKVTYDEAVALPSMVSRSMKAKGIEL